MLLIYVYLTKVNLIRNEKKQPECEERKVQDLKNGVQTQN